MLAVYDILNLMKLDYFDCIFGKPWSPLLISTINGTVCRYQSHAITCHFTACEIIIKCSFTKLKFVEFIIQR